MVVWARGGQEWAEVLHLQVRSGSAVELLGLTGGLLRPSHALQAIKAIVINELTAARWQYIVPGTNPPETAGDTIMQVHTAFGVLQLLVKPSVCRWATLLLPPGAPVIAGRCECQQELAELPSPRSPLASPSTEPTSGAALATCGACSSSSPCWRQWRCALRRRPRRSPPVSCFALPCTDQPCRPDLNCPALAP